MKKKNQTMIKYTVAFLLIISALVNVHAQAPYIYSINPTSASVGDIINVTGSNLTGVTAFHFGGAEGADLTIVDDKLLTVKVPFGAAFSQLSAIHPTEGIGYSGQKFNLTFDGQSINDGNTVMSNLSDQAIFPTSKNQTQDLCACDFDNDGKLDIAASNVGDSEISIFMNSTAAVGTVTFDDPISIINSFAVTNVICGDIDGDGWPDLMANELNGQGKIYTYRNDGTGDFEPRVDTEWTLPTNDDGEFRKPGRIKLVDLDLDGKPELVSNVEDENLVFYFINNSSSGDISFKTTPKSLSATENAGSLGLGGLDVADLNNDGFPEIITSNYTANGYYVFQNSSQPSSIVFNDPTYVETTASIRALKAGDLDNDGFADVIITNSDISSNDIIEISANNTSAAGADVEMNASFKITGLTQTWGLDLGDIDGDNDLDIIIGSEIENGFYVVMNTNPSTIAASSYSVGLVSESNNENSRNILFADMDSDGRPDFVYTNKSKDDVNGRIGIRLNEICFEPIIIPSGSVVLCTGESVDLVAPISGHTYEWKKDGGSALAETSNTLTVLDSDVDLTGNTYTVSILDGCNNVSVGINVSAPGEGFTAPTSAVDESEPCIGDEINLTATPGGLTASYIWTGPNGFLESGQNITISEVTVEHAGDYYVTATSDGAGCEMSSGIINVSITTLPVISIINNKPDYFCDGSTLDISTNEFTGYDYQWKLGPDDIAGQTDPTLLEASTAGDYTVTITDGTCEYTSAARTLTTVAPPTSVFTTSSTTICEDVELDFTATSTGADGLTIINNWDYADGSKTEKGDDVLHSFSAAGDYEVSMTAKYDGIKNADCTYVPATSTITIQAPPSGVDLELISSDNSDNSNFEKCAEKALRIRVDGDFASYYWQIDEDTVGTNAVLDVSEESTVFVNLTNDVKCGFQSSAVEVKNYTTGGIQIAVSSPNIIEADIDLGKFIDMEENQTSIELSVQNATDPAWEPTRFIDDTTATNVRVTVSNKQLISVYGTDILGCAEKDSVTLVIPGIQGDKNFTPNGDGINDCWEVSNVGTSDCQVVIFDSKGRRIREITFNGNGGTDDCVWDGNKSNGNALPDGMYYYYISCSDSANESSGSIFMAR